MKYSDEIIELLQLSARLGRDPLRVQASSGNTSMKLGGTLWIKASGKWLARAMEEDILVPLNLADVRRRLQHGEERFGAAAEDDSSRASIETALHAVLPHRVVIHTHSVSAIAWAVRTDGAERLSEKLGGLRWHWIPYMPSGLPLARAIEQALVPSSAVDVFVLANHGLVVCGEDCESAERLLSTVETRLEVQPRRSDKEQLPIDAISLRILEAGFLYPCHAIFLGEYGACRNSTGANLSRTQIAVLNGLLEVARRIPEDATVRYLSGAELAGLLTADAHAYKQSAEMSEARAAW